MAIFSPLNIDNTYDFFDLQIYELALNNRHIGKERIKFLKEGKFIIDTLAKNKNTMYYLNFINSERFKKFFKTTFVTCFDGTSVLSEVPISIRNRYNLRLDTDDYYRMLFITRKLPSDFKLYKIIYKNKKIVIYTKIPSDYEGYVLFISLSLQYLLESINFIRKIDNKGNNTKLYIGNICHDEFNIDFLEAKDILAPRATSYRLFRYFVIKYSLCKSLDIF